LLFCRTTAIVYGGPQLPGKIKNSRQNKKIRGKIKRFHGKIKNSQRNKEATAKYKDSMAK